MTFTRTFAALVIVCPFVMTTLSACNQTAAQTTFATQAQQVSAAIAEQKACIQQTREKVEFAEIIKYLADSTSGQFTVEQLANTKIPSAEEAHVYGRYFDESAQCYSKYISELSQPRPDLAEILIDAQNERKSLALSIVGRKFSWGEFAQKLGDINTENRKALLAADTHYRSNLQAENEEELANKRQAALIYLQAMQNQQLINAANRPLITNCNAYGTSVNCISQ